MVRFKDASLILAHPSCDVPITTYRPQHQICHHILAAHISLINFVVRFSPFESFTIIFNRRNGVVVSASASQSVDLGFNPQVESCQKILKNGICSLPAWRRAHKVCVKNKLASLLVVSLGKAVNGMPPSSCGKHVTGSSSLPVAVPQSDERHANRTYAHTHE